MREIKFRAWFINEKEMREVGMLRWENGEMSRIAGYWHGTRDNGWTDYDPKEDKLILMQFTGLKDKNGVEIYEGDIVNWRKGKGEVYWDKGSFLIKGFYLPEQDNPWDAFGENATIEVIGNIYQNHELLE